ncbi:hypothetical protein GTY65_13335 [Streptomyces sp. SID8379]|uniref:hypothetical protein n=1 Tax=unclassified Streptomyces TaxID=2593676 RepID=UPI000379B801|nr:MULTISPECIES: hypothetical protein [unclassified Streptomyces]MYW65041.1 hypothetical protein [Streptomyces sp. SID8379]
MRAKWAGLWKCAAWTGIGLSLYAGWLTVDDVRDRASSERDISAACDGLVSGAEVMDLQGGMVRAESTDWEPHRLDVADLPGNCVIYKVPSPGKSSLLFSLHVEADHGDEPLNEIGDEQDDPFVSVTRGRDPKADVTAVADMFPEPHDLGDGTLGHYTDQYVTVRAACTTDSRAGAPKLLNVTARAEYEDVSAADRERLARLARSAAQKVTDRLDCRTRLPALPDELTSVSARLRPARTADASCRWFARHLDAHGQRRLPDRALPVPVGSAAPVERCLLAVSPDQVRRVARGLDEGQREYADVALTHSPWWMRTVSYFGPEADTVGFPQDRHPRLIEPGTAGGTRGGWWASSLCDGRPALHTLSSAYLYDNVLGGKEIAALFRAYVDDITRRRGCTHVTFPKDKAFADVGK